MLYCFLLRHVEQVKSFPALLKSVSVWEGLSLFLGELLDMLSSAMNCRLSDEHLDLIVLFTYLSLKSR